MLLLQARLVHAHARAHRARHRNLLQEDSLHACGLGLVHRVHQRLQILRQRIDAERGAADRALDDARLVGAVLDLSGLRILDRRRDVLPADGERAGREPPGGQLDGAVVAQEFLNTRFQEPAFAVGEGDSEEAVLEAEAPASEDDIISLMKTTFDAREVDE